MTVKAITPSFAVVHPDVNEEAGVEACVKKVCTELDRPLRPQRAVGGERWQPGPHGEILHRLAPAHAQAQGRHPPSQPWLRAALCGAVSRKRRAGVTTMCYSGTADLTNDPADIPDFSRRWARGKDVIKASRFAGHGGG